MTCSYFVGTIFERFGHIVREKAMYAVKKIKHVSGKTIAQNSAEFETSKLIV